MRSRSASKLVLGLLLLIGSGCGGSGDDPADIEYVTTGSECPPGLGTSADSCCSQGCDLTGTRWVSGTLSTGAEALKGATNGNAIARSMIGEENTATDGRASAATESISRGSLGSGAGSATSGAPHLGSSSAGGGSRAGGGGGASGFGGGSVTTAAVESPEKIDESKLSQANKDTAYGGGGGGGDAGQSGSDPFRALASLGAGGGEGGIAPGSSQAQFAGGTAGGVNPLGSLDPSDYFSRGGNLTLFRRVSIAHERMSQSWALQNARNIRQAPVQ